MFTTDTTAIKGYGVTSLELARFDIPISQFAVSVYLPNNFYYGEFESLLKEVPYFTFPPNIVAPTSNNFPVSTRRANIARKSHKKKEAKRDYKESISYNEDEDDFYQEEKASYSNLSASQAGVKPVSMRGVSGENCTEFKFESFLVLENKEFVLKVGYKEIKKGFFEKRSTAGFPWLKVTFALLFVIVFIAKK